MTQAPEIWYAIWTRSRHEKIVHNRLTLKGIEAFLPVYERWSYWKDRRKCIQWPLFPGYCFVRVPEGTHPRILEVSGVSGFVGMNGRPEAVQAGEIEALRRLISSDYRYDPYPFLTEGMEVEIVRGPLAGVRGRLVRKDNAERLVLSVTLIRQGAALHIHPADIVPV